VPIASTGEQKELAARGLGRSRDLVQRLGGCRSNLGRARTRRKIVHIHKCKKRGVEGTDYKHSVDYYIYAISRV
jgi:hypothetical protein